MSTLGTRAWQNLKHKRIELLNGLVLELVPFDKHKGRHWKLHGEAIFLPGGGTLLQGEWKTWQRSIYTRQPKMGEGESSYGRGGGAYRTEMVRQSWLAALGESPENLNTERTWAQFKKLAAEL